MFFHFCFFFYMSFSKNVDFFFLLRNNKSNGGTAKVTLVGKRVRHGAQLDTCAAPGQRAQGRTALLPACGVTVTCHAAPAS